MEINIKKHIIITLGLIIIIAIIIGVNTSKTKKKEAEYKAEAELSNEIERQASIIYEWYVTPVSKGGGGNGKDPDTGKVSYFDALSIAKYLSNHPTKDYVTDVSGDALRATYRNPQGDFILRVAGAGHHNEYLTIFGISEAYKYFIAIEVHPAKPDAELMKYSGAKEWFYQQVSRLAKQ